MYVFISHSSTDAAIAQDICRTLEASDIQCFIAPRDIRTGHEYASEILNGLDRCDVFLLLMSGRANQSPHVLREVERAVSRGTPIIVYSLEDVDLSKSMQYFLMTHQWLTANKGDYSNVLEGIQEFQRQKGEKIAPALPHASKPEKKKKNLLPIISIAIALIALVAVICMLLLGKNNDSETKENETNIADENTEDNNDSNSQKVDNTTENSDDNEESSSTSPSGDNATSTVELGDTLTFGTYNNEPLEWNIIHISEDKTEAVIITKNIIAFKGIRGAGSKEYALGDDGNHYFFGSLDIADDYELQAKLWGNNAWDVSHLRIWLNSKDSYVTYNDLGPLDDTMTDHVNGYNLEAGFLSNFSKTELAVIKDTTVETNGTPLSDSDKVTTTDKVFLLSKDELVWFKEAGLPLFTAPTDAAVNNNKDFFYRDYCLDTFKTTNCPWWLRDPVEDSVSECYLVSHGAKAERTYETGIVAFGGYGVRPAMTIDLTSGMFD